MQTKLAVLIGVLALATAASATCDKSAKIAIVGGIDGNFPGWLQGKLPSGGSVTTLGEPTITTALLSQYNLVIFARLEKTYTTAESNAVVSYLDDFNGAVFSLAGFYDSAPDARAAEQILRGLGISYDSSALITSLRLSDEVVSGPTSSGVASISFVGGWRSSPYTGPGTSSYILDAFVGSINARAQLGQTIIRPSGGRLVAWGDEWLTFAPPNDLYNQIPGTAQFWLNAIQWVTQGKVCPTGGVVKPCDSTIFTASASCGSATFHSSTKGFKLAFSNTATSCAFSN